MKTKETQAGANEIRAKRGRREGWNAGRLEVCARIDEMLQEKRRSSVSEREKTRVWITRIFGNPPPGKEI